LHCHGQERAKAQELEQVIKELEEMEECTFKPSVHTKCPRETEHIEIKGLGRHLKLQDMAKQMKRVQQEWEKKVFFTDVNSHITQPDNAQVHMGPQPFKR
jgi:hypothetical protein